MGKATNKTVTFAEHNLEPDRPTSKKRVNNEHFKIDPSILYDIRDTKKKIKVNEDEGKNVHDIIMDSSNETPNKVQKKGGSKTVNSKRYKEVMEALSKPVSSYTLLYEPNLVPTSKKTPRKKVSFISIESEKMDKSKLECLDKVKLRGTPNKKWGSFPSNVKTLAATGVLDEVAVMYLSASREFGLRGIIKGPSYLCGCKSCNYSNALSADRFEDHAGCKTNHPNNHIYLENALSHTTKPKSLYKIVQELKNTPTNMLCDAIQTILGAVLNQQAFSSWRKEFEAASVFRKKIVKRCVLEGSTIL